MNTTLPESAYDVLNQAQKALAKGELQRARRLAHKAVSLAPEHEEPWLYLASVSSPQASISYLKKALEINPTSQQAKKGMRWAIQRYRKTARKKTPKRHQLPITISEDSLISRKFSLLSWSTVAVILVAVLLIWLWTPGFSFALPDLRSNLPKPHWLTRAMSGKLPTPQRRPIRPLQLLHQQIHRRQRSHQHQNRPKNPIHIRTILNLPSLQESIQMSAGLILICLPSGCMLMMVIS